MLACVVARLEEIQHRAAQGRISLVADRVRAFEDQIARQEGRDRRYRPALTEPVADADLVRVAGQGDQVFKSEDAGLRDLAADLGEQHPVLLGIEAVVAPRILHRLEGDAAHAGPFERMLDDVGDFMAVDALLHDHHERRRKPNPFKSFERLLMDARQFRPANVLKRVVVQGYRTGDIPLSAGHSWPAARRRLCPARCVMPFVLIMTWRIGRRFTASRISKNCG